ncbi:hypothetical protein AX769_00205 [Frondihabitans sp. PAMC 28766]|uniref:acyltransferase family protein n=1 Tax=Frondihabitans sp. PAMC 28766 TaxID=1795630 RepID=UPI00078CD574|nr:acyltransferase family protein [Frondihabitans sp. PAMC 28766]AMM18852.1 hypothetical protein AX769_00205 [Frondihabitans sp. PAMC 28766]
MVAEGAGVARHRARRAGTGPPERALRLEIQAARAIAIASVVVYHFWPGRLPGGYVGVDIFFAISGYLITGHIAKPVSAGTFSFRAFYARRAWRLLPAALTTLAVSTILTFVFVPQTLWQDFGEQIAASALYVENWTLAANSVDYSALNANSSIVQHFWSLSTEEQFYAVWPLILWLCAVVARRRHQLNRAFAVALGAVFVLSIAYSIVDTTHSPASYFITTTRAYEFAAGGLLWLALQRVRLPDAVAAAASWVGLAVIAVTLVTFSAATPFPSGTALLPIVGVALIVAGGMPRARWAPSVVFRLSPVQWLGDVSYSLYLWHWPLLIVAPYALGVPAGRPLPGGAKIAVLVLALVLADVSRRFIEKPLIAYSGARLRSPRPRYRSVLVFAVAAMLVVAVPSSGLAASVAIRSHESSPLAAAVRGLRVTKCLGAAAIRPGADCGQVATSAIVPSALQAASDDFGQQAGKGCQIDGTEPEPAVCTFGDKHSSVRIALVGDSHATNYAPALQLIADAHHWSLTTYLRSGCPLTSAAASVGAVCERWNEQVEAQLTAKKFDVVFVAALSDTPVPYPGLASVAALTSAHRDVSAAGYAKAWAPIMKAGSTVVALRDDPDPQLAGVRDEPTCVAQYGDGPQCDVSQKLSLIDDPLAQAARTTQGVALIDSTDLFCRDGVCPAVIGGVQVYRQFQHVTQTYMRTMAPYLEPRIVSIVAAAAARR